MRTAAQSLCEEPDEFSVRVKICGLTRVDEAVACVQAGADLIGLNFHAGSPRFVDLSRAREIIAAIARPAQAVGLFVNRPADEVATRRRPARSDYRSAPRRRTARGSSGSGPILDHSRVSSGLRRGHPRDERLPGEGQAGRPLCPTRCWSMPTSRVRWAERQRSWPRTSWPQIPPLPRLILAGGLTPENVAERVARVRPWMVDVASGVESAPGRKDRREGRRVHSSSARRASGDEISRHLAAVPSDCDGGQTALPSTRWLTTPSPRDKLNFLIANPWAQNGFDHAPDDQTGRISAARRVPGSPRLCVS